MKFLLLNTLLVSIHTTISVNGLSYYGLPIERCADGTIVMTGGTTGPTFPVENPCGDHFGAYISPFQGEDSYVEMKLDCGEDNSSCSEYDGYVIGIPEMYPNQITLENAGLAHNFIVHQILASAKTKEDVMEMAVDLMKYYAPDILLDNAQDILDKVMDLTKYDIVTQIYAWEAAYGQQKLRSIGETKSKLRGFGTKDETCEVREEDFEFIRKVMDRLSGILNDRSEVMDRLSGGNDRDEDEADIAGDDFEDLGDEIDIVGDKRSMCDNLCQQHYQYRKIVKVTRKAASKIPRHSDDCFKSTLKSFLAVLQASFAYGATQRGDWPWRTDGTTFLTTTLQLWGFGGAGVAGGVVAGAAASAFAYF